jgi:hypothetical protein
LFAAADEMQAVATLLSGQQASSTEDKMKHDNAQSMQDARQPDFVVVLNNGSQMVGIHVELRPSVNNAFDTRSRPAGRNSISCMAWYGAGGVEIQAFQPLILYTAIARDDKGDGGAAPWS